MSARLTSQLGRLFVLKLVEDKWNRALEGLLRAFQPAGMILPASRNRSASRFLEISERARKSLEVVPFVGLAADVAEPGTTQYAFGPPEGFPLPMETGVKSELAAEAMGNLRGALLRMHGANVDLDFSLDLAPSRPKSNIAPGAPATNPHVVAKCAASFLKGLRRRGVLACAGHFPGMESVEADRKTGARVSGKPMAALWREDLWPYRELLPKLDLVLISRAAYKAYDLDLPRPAMFSSEVVTGLLRVKLGYESVCVADVVDVESAPGAIDAPGAAVRAIEAGCDLVIVSGHKKAVEGAVRAIEGAREEGRISQERIQASLERIRSVKKALGFALRRHTAEIQKSPGDFRK